MFFLIKFFKPFFVDENEEKLLGKFPRFNAQIVDLEKKIQKVLETSISFILFTKFKIKMYFYKFLSRK